MAQIPSPIDSPVLPDGAIGTQEEVSALLVGNTLDGGTWKEYYHPDGTSSGIGDSPYTGVWSIIDTFFCFFYNSDSGNVPGCRSMTKDHQTNEMKFYTLDGRYRSSAIWYAGNPFDL